MPAKNYKHLKGLTIKAHFSACGNYRYLLTIQDPFAEKGDTVCAIMQNPSVADEFRADKSVQFLEKLLFEKKPAPFGQVGTLMIVNQFAFIQTRGFRGGREHVGEQNDFFIGQAIREADLILVAWGKNNAYSKRKWVIHGLFNSKDKDSLLQTRSHPSRGRYEQFISPYDPGEHLPVSVPD